MLEGLVRLVSRLDTLARTHRTQALITIVLVVTLALYLLAQTSERFEAFLKAL